MDPVNRYAPILHTGFADTYTEEEIKSFIQWLKKQGFSGFSTEGKSYSPTDDIENWLKGFINGIAMAAKEAERDRLDIWLFDEWGYPTGTAGGNTLKGKTEWRSKKLHLALDLHLEEGQTTEFTVPKNFLSASVWPVGRNLFGRALKEGINLYPNENGKISYTANAKRERLCVASWTYDDFRTVGVFIPDEENDAQGTLDLLSFEAVAYFITQMHERYLPILGNYFGRVIKGFFYDEPFVSFPLPYTFDIFEEFKREKAYDIVPLLPKVLASLKPKELYDYRDICTTRLSKSFYGQLSSWCEKNKLKLAGHQDLDHDVSTLDSVSGNFFKNMAKTDLPGIDYIWYQIEPGRFADFPRFAGSVKRLLNKQHAISESFAATTFCLFPDYMRYCMDHQIIRGIDKFFLMIADPNPEKDAINTPFSMKHPMSVTFGAMLNRRTAILSFLVNGGSPAARTAVYIPTEQLTRDLINFRPSSVSAAPYFPASSYINEAAEALCYMPLDFDYIWKDAFLEMDIDNDKLLAKNGQIIDTLIFTPSANFDSDIEEKLNTFINNGGRVIFIAHAPKNFIGKGIVISCADELKDYLIAPVFLSKNNKISIAHRKVEDGELFFLLNEDFVHNNTELIFKSKLSLQYFDFNLESWINYDDITVLEDENQKINVTFSPMEMQAYKLCVKEADLSKPKTLYKDMLTEWKIITPDGNCFEISGFPNWLPDWKNIYRGDYFGWMDYESSIKIPKDATYRLDLGEVCYAAVIKIECDGMESKEFKLPFAPFILDFDLKEGDYKITIKVLNTEVSSNIGTAEAEQKNLSGGSRSWLKTKIGSDRRYIKSGLFGPVILYELLKD